MASRKKSAPAAASTSKRDDVLTHDEHQAGAEYKDNTTPEQRAEIGRRLAQAARASGVPIR